LPWQPFLAFFIWGAHWRHLKNTTEPSMCGGDAALCQITLTTCWSVLSVWRDNSRRESCLLQVRWHGSENNNREDCGRSLFS